ncbi:hypothetical protein ACG7TL_001793 [Trametes sanguinea]
MPRDASTLATLNVVRERLTHWQAESANLFVANYHMVTMEVSLEDGGIAALIKEGYTKSKYGNIFYTIRIYTVEGHILQRFAIYVMSPSVNPDDNRAAMKQAIDYFLGTDETITTRDVVATPSA